MKKIFAFMLLGMTLAFASCGGSKAKVEESTCCEAVEEAVIEVADSAVVDSTVVVEEVAE